MSPTHSLCEEPKESSSALSAELYGRQVFDRTHIKATAMCSQSFGQSETEQGHETAIFCENGVEHVPILSRTPYLSGRTHIKTALRWRSAYGPKDLNLSDMIKYCARQTKGPGRGTEFWVVEEKRERERLSALCTCV